MTRRFYILFLIFFKINIKGIDCSLLSSIYFLSQTIVAAFMSLITSKFGNYTIVLIGAGFSLIGCVWISLFVIFPVEAAEIDESEDKSTEKTISKTL